MNARLNFSTRTLNDKLKIEFSSSFTDRNQQNGFSEALRYATLYNPTAPVLAVYAPYAFNGEQFGGYLKLYVCLTHSTLFLLPIKTLTMVKKWSTTTLQTLLIA